MRGKEVEREEVWVKKRKEEEKEKGATRRKKEEGGRWKGEDNEKEEE